MNDNFAMFLGITIAVLLGLQVILYFAVNKLPERKTRIELAIKPTEEMHIVASKTPFQRVTTADLMKVMADYEPDDEWHVLLVPIAKPEIPKEEGG